MFSFCRCTPAAPIVPNNLASVLVRQRHRSAQRLVRLIWAVLSHCLLHLLQVVVLFADLRVRSLGRREVAEIRLNLRARLGLVLLLLRESSHELVALALRDLFVLIRLSERRDGRDDESKPAHVSNTAPKWKTLRLAPRC